jgi:hypothetical protein
MAVSCALQAFLVPFALLLLDCIGFACSSLPAPDLAKVGCGLLGCFGFALAGSSRLGLAEIAKALCDLLECSSE